MQCDGHVHKPRPYIALTQFYVITIIRFFAIMSLKILLVPATFLDEAALEFGNACNGALRAAACHYQDLVLGRECITGTSM